MIELSYKNVVLHVNPLGVSISLACVCKCGFITTNIANYKKYGTIRVECKQCKEVGEIVLDRKRLVDYYLNETPPTDLRRFLDNWEEEQKKEG